MTSQTMLIFAFVAALLGLGLGIFISYRKFKKTKSYLEFQIQKAEKELEQDLQDILEIELMKTQAGQELSQILQREKQHLHEANTNSKVIGEKVAVSGVVHPKRLPRFLQLLIVSITLFTFPIRVMFSIASHFIKFVFSYISFQTSKSDSLDSNTAKEIKK